MSVATRGGRVLAAALVVAGLLAVQCAAPTEIDVEIFDEVCDRGGQVGFEGGASLEALGTGAFTTTSLPGACELGTKRVGRVVLSPTGSDDAKIAFEVVTRADGGPPDACTRASYRGCIVARRKLPFLHRSTITMRVDLRADCVDVDCSPDQTCVRGKCFAAETTCEGTCDDAQLLSGPVDAVDAGPPLDRPDAAPRVDASPPPRVVQIVAGANHTCVRWSDDRLSCWGDNARGQIRPKAARQALGVTTFDLGAPLRTIAAGGASTCAVLDTTGEVVCWGAMGEAATQLPVTVAFTFLGGQTAPPVRELAMGAAHACARTDQNTVYCWGDNARGQIDGNGTTASSSAVLTSQHGTAIAAHPGGDSTCAPSDAFPDRVVCWGAVPVTILVSAVPVTAVTLTASSACVAHGGGITCSDATASRLRSVTDVKALAGLATSVCWVDAAARVTCAQDAQGSAAGTPTALPEVRAIAAGLGHLCVQTEDASVVCWGAADLGQLGSVLGTPTSATPVPVPLP